MLKVNRKGVRWLKKSTDEEETVRYHQSSRDWLNKQQNATCLPGKRNAVKVDGNCLQCIFSTTVYVYSTIDTILKTPTRMSVWQWPNAADRNILFQPIMLRVRCVYVSATRMSPCVYVYCNCAHTEVTGVTLSPDQFLKPEIKEFLAVKIDATLSISERHCQFPSVVASWASVQRHYCQKDTVEESVLK